MRDYGVIEEVRRASEATGSVVVYDPFDSSILKDTGTRKVVWRDGMPYVRYHGFWCELNGFEVKTENPRIVVFRAEARDSYR